MAKDSAEKEQKKAQRAAKRAARKQTWSQLGQAFNLQRKQDKWLVPLMALGSIVPIIIGQVIAHFTHSSWWLWLILGVIVGIAVAMFIFSRRLQSGMYDRIEGQAGAAAWALQNLRNGVGMKWFTEPGIAANSHMDTVHRVVGAPGVVLVAEGSPVRLRPMLSQERKRISRILPDVAIYEVIVGNDEGQVPVKKLQSHLMRLPRNMKKNQVDGLNDRITAIERLRSPQNQIPKGPMPKGASMSGMNRRAKRASRNR